MPILIVILLLACLLPALAVSPAAWAQTDSSPAIPSPSAAIQGSGQNLGGGTDRKGAFESLTDQLANAMSIAAEQTVNPESTANAAPTPQKDPDFKREGSDYSTVLLAAGIALLLALIIGVAVSFARLRRERADRDQ
jgi:hypothetical protein